MWEKVKELKLIIAIVATMVPATIGGITWFANNIVFASEFNTFKLENEMKWVNYDEQRLRSEYYNLRNLRKLNNRDKKRLSNVEAELDHTIVIRTELEKELRRSGRIKITK